VTGAGRASTTEAKKKNKKKKLGESRLA